MANRKVHCKVCQVLTSSCSKRQLSTRPETGNYGVVYGINILAPFLLSQGDVCNDGSLMNKI